MSAPTAEIQDQLEDTASDNVEESPLLSTPGTPILTEEQLVEPNSQLSYVIVEMEATAPVSRGVSEGIEVVSFAGEIADLDGDYVVEEPPAEASVVSSNRLVFLISQTLICFTGAGGCTGRPSRCTG